MERKELWHIAKIALAALVLAIAAPEALPCLGDALQRGAVLVQAGVARLYE